MNNTLFSFPRFMLFLKTDLAASFRTIKAYTFGLLAVVMLIAWSSAPGKMSLDGLHQTLFLLILFLVGFLVTSSSFSDLHDSKKNFVLLLTPASVFEKFLCRTVCASFIFAIGVALLYFLFSLTFAGIWYVTHNLWLGFYMPFKPDTLKIMAGYIVTHTIFMYGSLLFKRAAFIKTVLVLCIVTFLLIIIVTNVIIQGTMMRPSLLSALATDQSTLGMALKIAFWGLCAPLFWLLSYRKFKKTEVTL